MGTTYTAASPLQSDIAIELAKCVPGAGDIVQIPPGEADWTDNLIISTDNVTLRGTWSAGTDPYTYPEDPTEEDLAKLKNGVWSTVVLDSRVASTAQQILSIQANYVRVEGIHFETGTRTSVYSGGLVRTSAGREGIRFTRCKFTAAYHKCFGWDANWGVIDGNVFEPAGRQWLYTRMGNWPGGTLGDGSWAEKYEPGNPYHALYCEHNWHNNSANNLYGSDGDNGMRAVFRYMRTNSKFTMHGTESSNPRRGGYVQDVYKCIFAKDAGNAIPATTYRSGYGWLWGCKFSTPTRYNAIMSADDERQISTFGTYPVWGQIDGKSGWDINEPGGPFATGTCTAAGSLTMTDSTKSWDINQWVGSGFAYLIHNITAPQKSARIRSNTADTITFGSSGGFGASLAFNEGDEYELWRVNTSMDQPGMGEGDLIDRTNPAWPNHVLRPIYCWGNTWADESPATTVSNSGYGNIVVGTHIIVGEDTEYTYLASNRHPLALEQDNVTSAPTISVTPTEAAATVGDGVVFTASVFGVPSPTLQWRKGGVNISGQTGTTLTFASAQESDSGTYDCVATNSEGSATSNEATLTVNPVPTEGQPNTYAKKKIRGKRLRDSLVAAAAVTVLSYQGFDLTFDGDWQTGTFVTGEPYIVIPSSATLTAISPGVVESGGVTRNGTQINLTVATAGNHGLDSRLGMGHVYDADLNIGLQLPYTINSACTIVTSLSHVADTAKVNDEQQLEKVAFFTVLQSAPAAGSFRPAPYGTDKTVSFNTSSINWSLLLNLDDEADLPSIATLLDQAEHPYVRVKSNWEAQFLNQSSAGSLYGNVAARRLGDVLGRLNTNHTQGEKAPLLYATIQQAIDWYAGLEAGMSFPADGGHNCGHKAYMVFVGSILNHSGMLAYGAGTGATSKFQEDHQHFTISQDDIDQTFYNATLRSTTYADNEDYIQSQLGTHEWGIRHTTEPHRDDNRWVAYRHVTGGPMFSIAVMIHLMGDTLKWNNLNFFSYNFDRFYGGTDVGVGAGANNIRTWAANRYLAHIA